MVTLSFPVTLGLIALVVDIGWSYWRQEACRTAAQAAAIAAAIQAKGAVLTCNSGVGCTSSASTYTACPSSPSSPPSDNLQTGCLYAQQNGFTTGGSNSRQNVRYAAYTSGSPVSGVSPNYWVRFVVAEKIPTLFSAAIGQPWMTVSARSTAGVFQPPAACVYALNHTNTTGITLDGGTSVTAPCGVWDNALGGSALSCSNNTTLNAGTNNIAVDGSSACSGNVSPAPITGQPQANDPFAGVPAPPDMNRCNSNGITAGSSITMPIDGIYEVCNGGISLNGNGTINLPAGIYYLKNGGMSIQNGTLNGSGVTIFLTGTNNGITINGNTTVNLSGPTSGTYEGLVIYEDRTVNPGPAETFNGGANMLINGTIYTPHSYIKYAGGNGTNVTALVGDTIDFTGSSTFGTDTSGSITGLPRVSAFTIE